VHVGNTGAAWSIFPARAFFLALLGARHPRRDLFLASFARPPLTASPRPPSACSAAASSATSWTGWSTGTSSTFSTSTFGSYTYPTFNVADSGICVGVILVPLALAADSELSEVANKDQAKIRHPPSVPCHLS
jgi:signal peptidase II